MNSRQRVQASLNHQQPDRVPLDMGSTAVTGIAAATYTAPAPGIAPTRPHSDRHRALSGAGRG